MNNNHLQGKTAIITGAGYATLSDGRCGSIGYGIATAVEGGIYPIRIYRADAYIRNE